MPSRRCEQFEQTRSPDRPLRLAAARPDARHRRLGAARRSTAPRDARATTGFTNNPLVMRQAFYAAARASSACSLAVLFDYRRSSATPTSSTRVTLVLLLLVPVDRQRRRRLAALDRPRPGLDPALGDDQGRARRSRSRATSTARTRPATSRSATRSRAFADAGDPGGADPRAARPRHGRRRSRSCFVQRARSSPALRMRSLALLGASPAAPRCRSSGST